MANNSDFGYKAEKYFDIDLIRVFNRSINGKSTSIASECHNKIQQTGTWNVLFILETNVKRFEMESYLWIYCSWLVFKMFLSCRKHAQNSYQILSTVKQQSILIRLFVTFRMLSHIWTSPDESESNVNLFGVTKYKNEK